MSPLSQFQTACCCIVLILASGCGGAPSDTPDLYEVNGTVTLDGAPLPGASLEFSSQQGRGSSATTDSDGKYNLQYSARLSGAIAGQHTVSISTRQTESESGEEIAPEKVPAKYNTETTLTAEVKPEKNVIDFGLKTE